MHASAASRPWNHLRSSIFSLFVLAGVLDQACDGPSDQNSVAPPSDAASAGASGQGGSASVGTTVTGSAGVGVAGSSGGQAGAGGNGGNAGEGGSEPQSDGAVSPAALRIRWIDTEGGAATLVVAPTGETIVVDAGWASDRDSQRIADALKSEAPTNRVDYMITTHYHMDHTGVTALARSLPIGKFVDHGTSVEPSVDFDAYQTLANAGQRMIVKPGDKLTLGELELTFVTSAGQVIDPLPTSTSNPTCAGAISKSEVAGPENPMSVGFVGRYGKFDFVLLGDLTWNIEQMLMCPTNRIGPIDLYQVDHHGMDISSSPQLVHALAPAVAVMNNGAYKGGSAATFDVLRASPGLRDVWSLHRVLVNDANHNADEALTANVSEPDLAYGIKAVVQLNGTYTLTNMRNGISRTYMSR